MPLRMAAYSQPQYKDDGEGWSAVSRGIEKKSRKTPRGVGYQTAGGEEGAEDSELRKRLCSCRFHEQPLTAGHQRVHRQVCWMGEVGQREQECGRSQSCLLRFALYFQVGKCQGRKVGYYPEIVEKWSSQLCIGQKPPCMWN